MREHMERRLVLGPGCMGEMQVRSGLATVVVSRIPSLPMYAGWRENPQVIPVETTRYRTVKYAMPFTPDSCIFRRETTSEHWDRKEEEETAMQWVRAGFAEVHEETDQRTLEHKHWAVLRVLVPD
jgi:hypothetical protein